MLQRHFSFKSYGVCVCLVAYLPVHDPGHHAIAKRARENSKKPAGRLLMLLLMLVLEIVACIYMCLYHKLSQAIMNRTSEHTSEHFEFQCQECCYACANGEWAQASQGLQRDKPWQGYRKSSARMMVKQRRTKRQRPKQKTKQRQNQRHRKLDHASLGLRCVHKSASQLHVLYYCVVWPCSPSIQR